MSQVHTLNWTNPTQRVDGTAYTQAMNAGYEIGIDGVPSVAIPVAWGTTFDLTTLAVWPTLKTGTHTVELSVVDTGGLTSAPGTTTFSYSALPSAPTALTVA